MRYWNAGYNFYSTDFLRLLKRAIEGEQQAIRNYQKQCQWIKDEYVRENLRRIIKDEELHVRILNEMYLKYIQRDKKYLENVQWNRKNDHIANSCCEKKT